MIKVHNINEVLYLVYDTSFYYMKLYKSYDILEGRGVITTISTKGTFISEDTKKATDEKINKEISIIREKIDELTKMGISYEEVIERIKK